VRDGIAVRAALVLFGVVVALALAEIGTRVYIDLRARNSIAVYGYGPSDVPGIAYLPKPHQTVNGRPFSNNLGLINAGDTSAQKAAGTFRIVLLGDSVAQVVLDQEGQPLHELLFSTRLATLLRTRTGRDVEVLNLSATGLSLAQELQLFQARGAALDPDLVLFAYCYNDPVATEIGSTGWSDPPTFPAFVWLIVRLWTQDARRNETSWYDRDGPVYHELEATFAAVGALARQRRVAIVGLPLLWNDRAKQIHLPALEELTARYEVPYVNLWERLHAADLESLSSRELPRDHVHYTPGAHALVAQALADAIRPMITDESQGR
jgi:lysophospholipase L1-like esterase